MFRFSVLSFTFAILFLAGCSSVPKPATYPMTYQRKMQAGHHWDVLAADTAKELTAELGNGTVFYVKTDGSSSFSQAFGNLLKTHLIDQGQTVSEEATESAVIDFDAQVIRHPSGRLNRPHFGTMTLIATGIRVARDLTESAIIPAGVAADMWIGSSATLTDHEVLITTRVTEGGRYSYHRTNLYYVPDRSSSQYASPLSKTAKLKVTGEETNQ